ncbi:MAG: O-antigen ligase family protein [Patescibacteria group bacterium]
MFSLATGIWVLLVGYLAWRYPHWIMELLAIALPMYLLRLKLFGIPTTWLELAIYAVFAVWVLRGYLRPQWWEPLFLYWQPLLLIGIGLVVGTVVSTEPLVSLGIIKGWFIDPLLLFILITNSTHKRFSPTTEFNYVVFGLWFSGVVLAVVALYQTISGNFITVDQRASAWFSSANYLSLYLVPIMVLVMGWWKHLESSVQPTWSRWIIWVGWGLMAGALYFTFSYAGWLALLIGLAVWGYWSFPKVKWWLIWAGGVVLVILSQWQSFKFRQTFDLIGRSSSHVRIQVWQTALLMIKEHWLTGIGLGLFEQRYLEFASRLFHPPLELIMLHAHNIFLQFWVNTGIIGFIGFVWLLAKWARQMWPFVVHYKRYEIITLTAAMVALLVHGLFDVAYWKNDLSALFWIIVALGAILTQSTHGRENLSHRN